MEIQEDVFYLYPIKEKVMHEIKAIFEQKLKSMKQTEDYHPSHGYYLDLLTSQVFYPRKDLVSKVNSFLSDLSNTNGYQREEGSQFDYTIQSQTGEKTLVSVVPGEQFNPLTITVYGKDGQCIREGIKEKFKEYLLS